MTDKLNGPKWLAEYLEVPLATVYQWSSRGGGPPAIRVGKHLRYRKSTVDAWLDAHTADNGTPAPTVPAA